MRPDLFAVGTDGSAVSDAVASSMILPSDGGLVPQPDGPR
jgi:hypothetical protein